MDEPSRSQQQPGAPAATTAFAVVRAGLDAAGGLGFGDGCGAGGQEAGGEDGASDEDTSGDEAAELEAIEECCLGRVEQRLAGGSQLKTHTRAIYQKLGVSARHSAIEQARLRNLL